MSVGLEAIEERLKDYSKSYGIILKINAMRPHSDEIKLALDTLIFRMRELEKEKRIFQEFNLIETDDIIIKQLTKKK